MIKNMKLKQKLIFSFSIIFVLLIVLGGSSVFCVNLMTKVSKTYAEQVLPSVEEIGLARRNMISVRRYLLNAIVAETPQDLNRINESMCADRESLYSSLDVIETLNPQYSSQIQTIRSTLQGVSSYNAQIMELSGKFTEAANRQAYDLYLNFYAPAFDEAAEMILTLNNSIDIFSVEQEQQVHQTQILAFSIVIAVTLIAGGAVIALTVTLTRHILRPVQNISQAMQAMAAGDFQNSDVSYTSNDEFGELADKIRETMQRIEFITEDLRYGLKEISQGNFQVQSRDDSQYVGIYASLREVVYHLIRMLNTIISQVNTSSIQVASGADQVASTAQALSQGATEQASSIQELAATLNEISVQVDDNAKTILLAREETESSVNELNIGSKKMQEMLNAMDDITASSVEIEKIIKTIEDIAFQTNILALNAAVEAARAGQAGKGFAVVAEEVRNLAAKTSESSKTTAELIEKSLQAVQNGKSIADETAASFTRIYQNVNQVAEHAAKIAENSNAQDEAIHQTSLGIDQISSVIQNNSATAEESAAASEQLSAQAQMLRRLMQHFHISQMNVAEKNLFGSSGEEALSALFQFDDDYIEPPAMDSTKRDKS